MSTDSRMINVIWHVCNLEIMRDSTIGNHLRMRKGHGALPSSSATCWMRLPDPLATRTTLELGSGSKLNSLISALSNSLSVMLSMMHMKRLIRIWLSFSRPCTSRERLCIAMQRRVFGRSLCSIHACSNTRDSPQRLQNAISRCIL